MTHHRLSVSALAVSALAAAAATAVAQDPLPRGSEPVRLDPADFSTTIDNQWWPMRPGSRWIYREVEDGAAKRVVVRVTNRTRRIANGITARVVRDTVTREGELVEDTSDWYAQDREGNVWYLGEATKSYQDGRVSREGSWEAGKDGAQAGVAIPAHPVRGLRYRQEYREGEAEDRAVVLSTSARASVPYGRFRGMVKTKDFTPLEPRVYEHKFYARGIGPVLTLDRPGDAGREELVRYVRGGD